MVIPSEKQHLYSVARGVVMKLDYLLLPLDFMCICGVVLTGLCYRLLIQIGVARQPGVPCCEGRRSASSVVMWLSKGIGTAFGSSVVIFVMSIVVNRIMSGMEMLEVGFMIFVSTISVGASCEWILGHVGLSEYGESAGKAAGWWSATIIGLMHIGMFRCLAWTLLAGR